MGSDLPLPPLTCLSGSSIIGGTMNRLSTGQRTAIIAALVEGSSVRATCRMTGAAKGTVLRLLAEIGEVCASYQDTHLRNLYCRRIECDEVWTFVGAKQKNVPERKRGLFGYGDVWTWVALDADSKLVVCWHLDKRDSEDALFLMNNLAS